MNPTTLLNYYSKKASSVTIHPIHICKERRWTHQVRQSRHSLGTVQAHQGGLRRKERIESRCTRWEAPSIKPNSNSTRWATGVGLRKQPCAPSSSNRYYRSKQISISSTHYTHYSPQRLFMLSSSWSQSYNRVNSKIQKSKTSFFSDLLHLHHLHSTLTPSPPPTPQTNSPQKRE